IERARSLQGAPVEFLGFVAQRVSRRFKKDGFEKDYHDGQNEIESGMLAGNLREFSSGRKYKIPNIHEFANAMVGIEFLGIIEKIDSAISQRLDGEFFSPLGQYADHGNQKFRYLLGFTESFHSLDLSDQEVSSITDGVSEKPRGNVKKRGNKAFVAHISREAERKRKVLDYEWLSILSAISDIAGRDV